jgi:hypothetical protein
VFIRGGFHFSLIAERILIATVPQFKEERLFPSVNQIRVMDSASPFRQAQGPELVEGLTTASASSAVQKKLIARS